MIDSGAELSLISASICDELGLPILRTDVASRTYDRGKMNLLGVLEADVFIRGYIDHV